MSKPAAEVGTLKTGLVIGIRAPLPGSTSRLSAVRAPAERSASSGRSIVRDDPPSDAVVSCWNAAASMGRSRLGTRESTKPGRTTRARAAVSAVPATRLRGRTEAPLYVGTAPLSSHRPAPGAVRGQCWTTISVLVPGWAGPLVSPMPLPAYVRIQSWLPSAFTPGGGAQARWASESAEPGQGG